MDNRLVKGICRIQASIASTRFIPGEMEESTEAVKAVIDEPKLVVADHPSTKDLSIVDLRSRPCSSHLRATAAIRSNRNILDLHRPPSSGMQDIFPCVSETSIRSNMSRLSIRCRQSGGSESTFPRDLWIEILSRMPAKSVGRFGCVSKFCRELIASHDFIRQHQDQSIKTRASVVLQGSRKPGSSGCEFKVDFDFSVVTARAFVKPSFNEDEEEEEEETKFEGCCRGIFCYSFVKPGSKSTRLVFWNPLTGAYRRSLAEHDDRPPSITSPWPILYHVWCFLGYDAVNDDLKVLKMMRHADLRSYSGNEAYAFAVYSSKTDSWRKVEALPNKLFIILSSDGRCDMFVEGTNCVHMLLADYEHDEEVRILAFDFATDKFNLNIPIPQQCRNSKIFVGLSSLDGCLCFYHSHDGECFHVWMMKEYGVAESWTRVFSLKPGPFQVHLMPLTFVNNNGRDRLVVSTTESKGADLYLCDLQDEQELKEALPVVLEDARLQPTASQQHLDWNYIDCRYCMFAETHRQP